MIRFIVTKEIEVDDSVFEIEDVGVFDHEEEAKELASTIYNEMPEYEKQYYAVSVWKASGENIDTDDWDTFEECETVDIYPAKAIEGIEESLAGIFFRDRLRRIAFEFFAAVSRLINFLNLDNEFTPKKRWKILVTVKYHIGLSIHVLENQ